MPPSLALNPLLTVAQAKKLTGKSQSTIIRWVREIAADPLHPDRNEIQPSREELDRLRAAREPYVWKIDRELLLRRFPPKDNESSTASVPADGQPSTNLVVQVLQEQLHSKDQQIRSLEKQLDRKDEQIANLNERQRETNVLMNELQKRLSLAPPAPRTIQDVATAEPSSATQKPPRPTGMLRRFLGL